MRAPPPWKGLPSAARRGWLSFWRRSRLLFAFPSRGRLCVGNTAFPIQPPPLRGTSFQRKEGVSTRAPSLGRGCRAQRGGVGFLYLRRSRLLFAFPSRGRLCLGDTAFPIQPPPLRGTSFHRKEGVSTLAPSLGRGCRAQRGGVGFLFLRRSRLLFAFPTRGRLAIRGKPATRKPSGIAPYIFAAKPPPQP